eukprot:436521-Rhodomonas_salina.5
MAWYQPAMPCPVLTYVHGADMCRCYAMSGTGCAMHGYAAISHSLQRAIARERGMCLRACYSMSGTDEAYGTIVDSHAMPCPCIDPETDFGFFDTSLVDRAGGQYEPRMSSYAADYCSRRRQLLGLTTLDYPATTLNTDLGVRVSANLLHHATILTNGLSVRATPASGIRLISLRDCYAMSGTDLVYGTLSPHSFACDARY